MVKTVRMQRTQRIVSVRAYATCAEVPLAWEEWVGEISEDCEAEEINWIQPMSVSHGAHVHEEQRLSSGDSPCW